MEKDRSDVSVSPITRIHANGAGWDDSWMEVSSCRRCETDSKSDAAPGGLDALKCF